MKTKADRKKKPPVNNRSNVRIEFTHPSAGSVCIAGSFNDWHPAATEMIALGNGRWAKELTLPPGTYEYRLVIDGEWINDPHALESVPNPFGGTNSVVRVPAGKGYVASRQTAGDGASAAR